MGQGADRPQVYVYDDAIDTSKKSAMVDWYYKRDGLLHYAKIVNGEVLYASQEDPACAGRGFYDHGSIPLCSTRCFSCEGMPAGFGYLDVCKEPQMYIDRLNQVILKNAIMASRPRWFVRQDAL